MRTGACTVQQALTPEAAAVLKHALGLARRRGHAQVTPLHVAATLLSSTSTTTTTTTSRFRRACLRSHPLHPNSHPLHCRALELCFNVALNRLPTTPAPPSSSPTILPPQPSLSNALIAALKRAQAHQRRGCIEQHQQQTQQHQQQQQQQPLLAIKVEVEQLVLSILDDPSVSRVMREAGFSSTCVKNNLEESSSSSSSTTLSLPPTSLFDSQGFWQTTPHQLLRATQEQNPPLVSSRAEDLKVVIDALVGRNGKRRRRSGYTVVVGDSVSYCESLVAELMGRVERGEVPEDLRGAHFARFHLSPVQVKFMCRGDVEVKVAELRRKVGSLALERKRVVVYLGDLRWTVGDEGGGDGYSYKPADHVVAEVGRLQSEWRCGGGSRVWLLATASYQTHMRCQMRQPSLEAQWGLQAVLVPSGGLTLSINTPSSRQESSSSIRSLLGSGLKPFSSPEEGQEKLTCCGECASYFEKEASHLKKSTWSSLPPNFPCWMQPQNNHSQQEEILDELRRKWNRICQSLHQNMSSQTGMCAPFPRHRCDFKTPTEGSTQQLWPSVSPHSNLLQGSFSDSGVVSIHHFTNRRHSDADHSTFLTELRCMNGVVKEKNVPKQWFLGGSCDEDVRTTLALSSTPFSDCATSKDRMGESEFDPMELQRRLKENMPWQSEVAGPIADALREQRSNGKGSWLLVQGTDPIAMQRLPMVLAEFFDGSVDGIIWIDARKPDGGKLKEALRKDMNRVVAVDGIDCADSNFLQFLSEGLKSGSLRDSSGVVSTSNAIFILSSNSHNSFERTQGVIRMRLQVEEAQHEAPPSRNLKRKAELEMANGPKIPRRVERLLEVLDLNLCVDEEDNISSDVTHEEGTQEFGSTNEFIELVPKCFRMDACPGRSHPIGEYYLSKLLGSFKEVKGDGSLSVDEAVVDELVRACRSFTEPLFEKWLTEVFQICLVTVENGGKLRLVMEEGKAGSVLGCGFRGSVLPNRIGLA